jgi:hypothetical protein
MKTAKRLAAALVLLAPLAAPAATVNCATLEQKVLFGYQAWFDCPSPGSNHRSWSHWARGTPSAESLSVDMYPDLREFAAADLCAVPGMTIGSKPAYLFSARNPEVVTRHFRWMKEYGLDGALVQRFLNRVPHLEAEGDIVWRDPGEGHDAREPAVAEGGRVVNRGSRASGTGSPSSTSRSGIIGFSFCVG